MYTLLTYVLLAFIGLIPFVTGAPPAVRTVSGSPGAVYKCPSNNFRESDTGRSCKWFPPGEPCQDMPGRNHEDRYISIGPDAGGYCLFYTEEKCKGEPSELELTLEEINHRVKK
jgi:hypothetical protein